MFSIVFKEKSSPRSDSFASRSDEKNLWFVSCKEKEIK